MDRFDAMIKDTGTKSWWQHASRAAVAGDRLGRQLTEIISTQTTLAKWLKMFRGGKIILAEPDFLNKYSSSHQYLDGTSQSKLTGTDTRSWENKSWVIGIKNRGSARAYDWNYLKEKHFIQDTLGAENILITLSADGKSYFAFSGPACAEAFRLSVDTLYGENST